MTDIDDLTEILNSVSISNEDIRDQIFTHLKTKNIKWFRENIDYLSRNLSYEEIFQYYDIIIDLDDNSYNILVILNILEELLYRTCVKDY